ELFTTLRDEEIADEIGERLGISGERELICLNPGAAFGAAKHWPTDSFATLAQQLADSRDCQVLVLCGPGERDLARHIQRLAARPSVLSLSESPLSIGLTKALVRR